MPFIVGAVVIFVLVVAPLWRRFYAYRANVKFQRSIGVYDESRRARILAGADPRSIPTAEENLCAMGFGSQVKNIERLPRPDPLPPAPPPAPMATPALATPKPGAPPSGPWSIAAKQATPTPPTVPTPALPRAITVKGPELSAPSRPMPLPEHKQATPPTSLPSPAPSPVRIARLQPTEPSLQYRMTYATEWGEVTERRIRLKRAYSEHGEVYVEAHCYLRRAQRTFRADRMLDLVEVDTETSIVDPAAHFLGFIDPEDIVTPEHELVMAKARPGLRALAWIGRASGDLDPETIALLMAFCSDRARIGKGATNFDTDLAERWITDDRPTFDVASAAVSRMKRGGPEWQMTYDRAREVAILMDAEKRGKRLARVFKP